MYRSSPAGLVLSVCALVAIALLAPRDLRASTVAQASVAAQRACIANVRTEIERQGGIPRHLTITQAGYSVGFVIGSQFRCDHLAGAATLDDAVAEIVKAWPKGE